MLHEKDINFLHITNTIEYYIQAAHTFIYVDVTSLAKNHSFSFPRRTKCKRNETEEKNVEIKSNITTLQSTTLDFSHRKLKIKRQWVGENVSNEMQKHLKRNKNNNKKNLKTNKKHAKQKLNKKGTNRKKGEEINFKYLV